MNTSFFRIQVNFPQKNSKIQFEFLAREVAREAFFFAVFPACSLLVKGDFSDFSRIHFGLWASPLSGSCAPTLVPQAEGSSLN